VTVAAVALFLTLVLAVVVMMIVVMIMIMTTIIIIGIASADGRTRRTAQRSADDCALGAAHVGAHSGAGATTDRATQNRAVVGGERDYGHQQSGHADEFAH